MTPTKQRTFTVKPKSSTDCSNVASCKICGNYKHCQLASNPSQDTQAERNGCSEQSDVKESMTNTTLPEPSSSKLLLTGKEIAREFLKYGKDYDRQFLDAEEVKEIIENCFRFGIIDKKGILKELGLGREE